MNRRRTAGIISTVACVTGMLMFAPAAYAEDDSPYDEICSTTPLYDYDVVPATATTTTKRAFNGSMIAKADGSLLLVSDEYTAVEDWDPGVITSRTSTDGGATWSSPTVVQSNIGVRTVAATGLVRLGPTKLGLMFYKNDSASEISLWFKVSLDDGATWGTEYQASPGTGHLATANDRVVRLSTGRLIVPIGGDTSVHPGESGAFAMYSDDDGATWEISDMIPPLSSGAAEPVLVELTGGDLLMLIRGTGGTIEKSYSTDGGETWSATESTGVQSPYAPQMVKRIDGRLVLLWNNSPTESRRPLTLAVSDDEGDTWQIKQDLTSSTSGLYAYPSLLHHDGKIYTTVYTYVPVGTEYTLPLRLQVWDDCILGTAPADDGIPLSATVDDELPGSLSMTVADHGAGVALSQTAALGDRTRFEASLPSVTVTDSRTSVQVPAGGWTASGQATSFRSGANVFTADHLGWTPSTPTARDGLTVGGVVGTSLSGGTGLEGPTTLASASGDGRRGETQLDAALRLELPSTAAAGTYRGDLTVSLFPVD